MEADRLLKINQALQTLEGNLNQHSSAVKEEAEAAMALPHDEQVERFRQVASETLAAAEAILELYPDGEVECALGSYDVALDDTKIGDPEQWDKPKPERSLVPTKSVAVYRENKGKEEADELYEIESVTCVTYGKYGAVILAPLIEPDYRASGEVPMLTNNWHDILDARETLQAIHAAITNAPQA